ncbi:MAG: hypothetical protein HFJ28_00330 [Clostridia bacterium]|jgi:t-SNARE complex subunit (syntaxin)|nr:hypothetical protein [Clostridia bacterium]
MNKEYEMQKHVVKLQKELQESNKSKPTELDALKNEIASLIQLYRYYDELYSEELSKSDTAKIETVEQIEKLLGIAEKQMSSGIISREHFLEAARRARENLLTVFRNAGIGKHANLLVEKSTTQIIETTGKKEEER